MGRGGGGGRTVKETGGWLIKWGGMGRVDGREGGQKIELGIVDAQPVSMLVMGS